MRHVKGKLDAGFEAPPCPADRHPGLHQGLEICWDLPRDHPAGESMTYSNRNYELLGEVVRRVRGMAFQDAARDYVFEPLGMNDSYFSLPESLAHRYVIRPPHAPLASKLPGFPGLNSRAVQDTPSAGSGLCTTPGDLAIFGQMILGGGSAGGTRVLSPASVAAMSRDQIPRAGGQHGGNAIRTRIVELRIRH